MDQVDPLKLIFFLASNSNLTDTKVQEIINVNEIDINNIKFETMGGMSPLMFAVMVGNYQKVELFLKNSAYISYKDNNGKNVYDYLEKMVKNKSNKDKIYEILKKYEKQHN